MLSLNKWASRMAVGAVVVLCAITAVAQSASDSCKLSPVVPLGSGEQPPPKIVIDPPLGGPLASRGVVIIQYCAENLRIMPVFGPQAAAVSPRVGHIHVALDDASWVWADASGTPIILQGLSSGSHKVRIDLVDANHHLLDKGTVSFVVPPKMAADTHH